MEKILILDFGGQYNQLIARRVRECNVYCEVHPHTMTAEQIRQFAPIGIIFTGRAGQRIRTRLSPGRPRSVHPGGPGAGHLLWLPSCWRTIWAAG